MEILSNFFSRWKKWTKLIFFLLFFCLFTGEILADQVSGRVTSSFNPSQGISGVTVEVQRSQFGLIWSTIATGTTNSSGNYSITYSRVSGYSYRVHAEKDNYSISPSNPSLSAGTQTQNFSATVDGVEGFVKDQGGNPINNVQITFQCPTLGQVQYGTTDVNGFYSIPAGTGWHAFAVVVTPSKTGWLFTPSERSLGAFWSSQSLPDFIGERMIPITGTIARGTHAPTNLSGISVSLTGGPNPYSASTNSSGFFLAYVKAGYTYTITPTKPGLTITTGTTGGPVTDSVNIVGLTATPIDVTFQGTIAGVNYGTTNIAISGTYADGIGYSNTLTGLTTTYNTTINNAGLGAFTLTPTAPGYEFNPTSASFSDIISSPITQNFAATKKMITLSGRVTDPAGTPVGGTSNGIPNVIVRLSGDANQQTTTAADGSYSFTVPARSAYTIKVEAEGTGYLFSPDSITIEPSTLVGDSSGFNFTGTLQNYTISGTVYNGPNPFDGVTITVQGTNAYGQAYGPVNITTPTGGAGTYQTALLQARGNYTITASRAGYTFVPTNKTFNFLLSNKPNEDFATGVSTAVISGTVRKSHNGNGLLGVQLQLTTETQGTGLPSFSGTTTTDDNGQYSFTIPVGSQYRVTPLTEPDLGYTYSPEYRITENPLLGDTSLFDFTATLKTYPVYVFVDGPCGDFLDYPVTFGVTCYSHPELGYIDTTVTVNGIGWINLPAYGEYLFSPVDTGMFSFTPPFNFVNNLRDEASIAFWASYRQGPQLISPTNGVVLDNLTPTLTWAPVGAITTYELQISRLPNFESVNHQVYINGTSYDIPEGLLDYDSTYYWRVRGAIECDRYEPDLKKGNISKVNDNGYYFYDYTDWSEVWSFTTGLEVPTLVSPPNYPDTGSTVSPQPTLTWNLVSGALEYEVTIYSDAGCSNIVRGPQMVTGTNWVVTPALTAGQSYWWRVRAHNVGGYSGYSSTWRFIVDAGIPVLKSPANGAIGVLRSPTFEWYPADGATSYDLEYSTSGDFTSNVVSFNNITGTSKTVVTPLNILTTYFWRVRANGPGGKTNWSSIWSFRTAAGIIGVTPNPHVYPTTVVNRVSPQIFTVSNDGDAPLRVSSLSLTGADAAHFQIVATLPINIAAHSTQSFIVNYIPKSVGTHNATLLVDHNDASTAENPLQVILQGTAIPTAATLNLPNTLNFGNVAYLTAPITRTIQVGNNSNVPGDILILNSYYFENTDGIFEMVTPFPVVLEPGTTYDLVVKFNPTALGTQTNKLHILNTSLNTPDAVVNTVGTVIQGGLIVTPTSIDFGNTSVARPFVLQQVTIQNNSATNITISDKSITGDVSSFSFEQNVKPITLAPNQTDTLIVKFMPPTLGRKNGVINIVSNDPIAPNIFVPMTGIGGEFPVITVIPTEVNFGDIQKNQTKDTTITIRNDGSLDLVITSKTFEGTDKALFTFIADGSPITLRHGETHIVRVRITGNLPTGDKNAVLQIMSNDPNNPVVNVNLLASVKTSSLSTVDKVEFDSVGIGYYVDSTITVRNIGNIAASINRLEFDGAFASDFSIVGATLPMEVKGGESVQITIRFKPLDLGLRYARLIIYSTDPVMPELPVVVKGYGKQPKSDIFVTDGDGKPLDDGLNFGTIVIFESKTLGLLIKNLSKYAKLRIDSMYLDLLADQPFSFDKWVMPQIIPPGGFKLLNVTFNPKGLQRSYTGYLNIKFSDSTASPSSGATIATKLKGHVIFPGSKINLKPVLDFGRVLKDKPSTVPFKIENRGEAYLKIDSIVITGADAEEFKVVSPTFPVTVDPDGDLTVSVSFLAKKVGTKDAKIMIYWNDVFTSGEIKIVAECYVTGNQTTAVTALNEVPTTYALKQNYPNPFNPSTRIEYSIPENSFVSIKVYNSVGQLVATLVNENQSVGTYRVEWSAKNVPSGIYFYRMETSKFTTMKKMLLLK
jgi:hypothetical protein